VRISTNLAFQRGLDMMQRLQAALDRTQQQVSRGRRLLTPSDDPIAAARSLELRESAGRTEQFDRNAGIARNRLNYEETALVGVNDLLQRVRELALQANNDTLGSEARAQIAVELRERTGQLVDLANQRDGTGRYLFAGTRDETKPVSRGAGGYSYQGDQVQRPIQIGEDRRSPDGDTGAAVFFSVRDGNGTFSARAAGANTGSGVVGTGSLTDLSQYDGDSYTLRFTAPGSFEVVDSGGATVASGGYVSGASIAFRGIVVDVTGEPAAGDEFAIEPSRNRDMFGIVEDLARVLESPAADAASRAALHNGINAGLADIDQAIGRVLDVRTRVGTRLSAIEDQADTNGAVLLTLQETISGIEDLDYAEALSKLSVQVTTLEATQQTFVRTQGLSLFNFL